MTAAFDPTTKFATAVGQLVAREWRIFDLAAEAEIFTRHLLQHILAGWTTPALCRLGAARPRDGALEMQHMVTVLARPGAMMCLDLLHAHETLQTPLLNVSHQFLSLRELFVIRCASRRDLLLLLMLLLFGRWLSTVVAVARIQLLGGAWIAINPIPIAIPVVASLVTAVIVVALLLLWLLPIITISITIAISISVAVSVPVSIPFPILVSFYTILAKIVASLLATVASLWLRLLLLGGWRIAASLM